MQLIRKNLTRSSGKFKLIHHIPGRTRHQLCIGSSLLISASSHLVPQPPCSRPQNTTRVNKRRVINGDRAIAGKQEVIDKPWSKTEEKICRGDRALALVLKRCAAD